MGCGTSSGVAYSQIDKSIWRGKLHIDLKKAAIQEDVQWIGKQDPYIKFTFGRQEQKSEVCEDGGQFPEWHKQEFEFQRTNEEDTVYIFIGEGGFALTKVRQGAKAGKVDQNCFIYGNDQKMGEVFMSIWFDLLPECEGLEEVNAVDTTGKLLLKPKKAVLQRDTNAFFGTMSPICIGKLGSDVLATSANMEGGLNPKWLDELIFTRDELQRNTIVLEVKNFDDDGDNELIGTGFMSISPLLVPNRKLDKTIDLFYQGKVIGNIQIEAEYVSDDPEKQQQGGKQQTETGGQQQQQVVQGQQKQQQEVKQSSGFPTEGNQEYKYPNGDFYSGEWLNGCRHGRGLCKYRIGMQYDGEWLNDMWHGAGTLKQSGTTYVGQFLNGKKNGSGKLQWDGKAQAYDGEWKDNIYHGIGLYTNENGVAREAEFDMGRRVKWLDERGQQQIQQVQQYQQQGAPGFMMENQPLQHNQLMWSPQGMCFLKMQGDGKIAIYRSFQPFNPQQTQFLWQNTPQQNFGGPFMVQLQQDQNLCVYNGQGQCIWSNQGWNGQPIRPLKLVMQDDGKLCVINGQGMQVWSNF